MKRIDDYFCPIQGAAFAHAVPSLRAKIGIAPFEPLGSNYGVAGNTFLNRPGFRRGQLV